MSSTEPWLSAYAGLTDSALAQLANLGLVRRAAKMLAAGGIDWVSRQDRFGTVGVASFMVRLDGGGLAAARCPCPAGGVCPHMVAAAMFARDSASRLGLEPPTVPAAPDAAVPAPPVPAPAAVPVAASAAPTELGSVPNSTDAAIAVPSASAELGTDPNSADTARPGPTPDQALLLEAVRSELSRAVRTGLSHLQSESSERLAALASDARAGGLPLLAGLLGTAAGQAGAIASRRDDLSETEVTSSFAQAWALTRALEHADAESWPRLRGTARRVYSTEDAPDRMTLVPLGASWWETATGARGITMTAWDVEASAPRAVTAARPLGLDVNFGPSLANTAFWGVPLTTLLSGSFRLDGPRLSEDGRLAPTGARATPEADGFDADILGGIVRQMSPGIVDDGFGIADRATALLALDRLGRLAVDESEQQLVWTVPLDGGGELALRQPVNAAARCRIDNLAALENWNKPVRYVLVERVLVRSRPVWQPVSLFVGRVSPRLLALDLESIPERRSLMGALRRRLRLLTQRWAEEPGTAPPPRRAVAVLRDDVRDLTVALAATGRLRLSPAMSARCHDLTGRLDDLALATLAGALRALEADPSPENLLRAHFLADRLLGP
ncbi:MAG: hypothetical protein LBK95_07650 [Bifidobacteriaceae bacterium]|jgi:hypothetical protein|nr:hypothetical protein [Bifidobacteriaceae bacterium]